MITLEELNEVKEKRKTNLYYAEKEYLQYIFLNAISRYPENFIFKGGTCLRICYGLERASEDLDFSTNRGTKEVKKMLQKCLKEFELLNIKQKSYVEKEYKGNIRYEIRFEGPLFSGKPSSTNMLKIDFNKQKVKNKVAKVVPRLFSDVPLFTLIVLDEKEILAEKIRALVNRKQPRDMYDTWVLLNKGTTVDKELMYEKLKEEKSNIKKIVFPSKEEYERDLKYLVKILPSYEQARKDVEKIIAHIRK